jgi:predicted mannosyl-3-phosphoglycerate phosphatase (HAD superfamily)
MRLEGAERAGRYFCTAFARPHTEASAAVAEIAAEAEARVVALSQLSVREIARNTGESPRNAELAREREFSELFFFAGEAEQAARRFSEVARRKGWETVAGDPFWELRFRVTRNGRPAARYLMDLYRRALRTKLRSVGIGSQAQDAHLLSAVDMAIVLPRRAGEWDSRLISQLPRAVRGDQPGPAGWSHAVGRILQENLTYSKR